MLFWHGAPYFSHNGGCNGCRYFIVLHISEECAGHETFQHHNLFSRIALQQAYHPMSINQPQRLWLLGELVGQRTHLQYDLRAISTHSRGYIIECQSEWRTNGETPASLAVRQDGWQAFEPRDSLFLVPYNHVASKIIRNHKHTKQRDSLISNSHAIIRHLCRGFFDPHRDALHIGDSIVCERAAQFAANVFRQAFSRRVIDGQFDHVGAWENIAFLSEADFPLIGKLFKF